MANFLKHSGSQFLPIQFNDQSFQGTVHQNVLHHQDDIMQHVATSNLSFIQPPSIPPDAQQIKSAQPPPNTIAMSTLIDFVVYKTYHDISVMSDILPSKTDIERKTAIVDFSSRSRKMFIRLLSLVKWASFVGKVVRCSDITTFLDRQALHFVDTADKLHILANQLVIQARLPNFSVPAAVDVLTTGTYPRLPLCIRDRIISPDPLKTIEKSVTLKRINQIILYRLVTESVPAQIVDVTVEKGFVLLHVPYEFKAYITLMGDGPDIPWRILKIEFLVEDFEIGNGRSLVHPLQVNYVHELVQSRLFANDKPLKDLFDILHSFCLSLQLEVLFAQANRLITMCWGKFLFIEEYIPSSKLVISYWRITQTKKHSISYNITIQESSEDCSHPLQVIHSPPLLSSNVNHLVEPSSDNQSILLEYLIHQSITARSYNLLNQIKDILHKHIRHDASYFVCDEYDHRAVLFIPLFEDWKQSECLRLLVDPQTGYLIPSLDGIPDIMLDQMEKEINDSGMMMIKWFHIVRGILAKLRFKRFLQHLPVLCLDHLNLHDSMDFGDDCFYIKFLRHPSYYLVVTLISDPYQATTIYNEYKLLATFNGLNGRIPEEINPGSAMLTIKSVDRLYPDNSNQVTKKSSCATELVHMVELCSSRIPFIKLINSFEDKGLDYQGVQEEGVGMGLVCHLLTLPNVDDVSPEVNLLLNESLVQCSFRLNDRGGSKVWVVELLMKDPPLRGLVDKNNDLSTLIAFHYDAFSFTHIPMQKDAVKLFLLDWSAVCHLYSCVVVFAEQLHLPGYKLSEFINIYSYNYKSITIQYGRSFSFSVTISWSPEKKFFLRFARSGRVHNSNAHILVRHYLTESFNSNPDISNLLQILIDTSEPLQALSHLPCTSLPGIQLPKPAIDLLFTIIPQTATRLRIYFLAAYCIDVNCCEDKRVLLWDGAFSQFEFSKIKDTLIPIPGFGKFLSKYTDPSDVRPSASSEKDNPTSPSGQQLTNLKEIPHPGSYSGSYFTKLAHASLDSLVRPISSMFRVLFNNQHLFCPLEQFLNAAVSRRYLNKCIVSTESVSNIAIQQNAEGIDTSLASAFVTRSLQFVCQPHPQDMRKLVMKVNASAVSQNIENWTNEDLQILEKFFEVRVSSSSYRHAAMKSFFNIISAPSPVLKDLIQLIKIELLGNSRSSPFTSKWSMSLCLTSPPTQTIANVGEVCVAIKGKVLIFIQLSPVTHLPQVPPQSIIAVPLLYEPVKNHVSVLNVVFQQSTAPPQELQIINNILIRFSEAKRQNGAELSISAAVKYLMEAFTVSGITN